MRLTHTFVLAFTLLGLAPPLARAQSPIRLNEFLAGPARDWNGDGLTSTRDDEWIEIVNASGAPVDLQGYLLTDGDKLPRFGFSGLLGSGERQVVYGKDSVDWERATGHPVFGLALGNTGDSVMLWQVTGLDTVLVDSYTYLPHQAASDRAMGRVPDGGAWELEDGLDPYTGTTPPLGTGCMPSPAAANVCSVTPVRTSTWGRVKSLYR